MKDWRMESTHQECPSCHGKTVVVSGEARHASVLPQWHILLSCRACGYNWIGHTPWTRNEKRG